MQLSIETNVTILFEQWTTLGEWDLLGSCLAIFFLAVVYEGLKVFREVLTRNAVINVRFSNSVISKNMHTILTETNGDGRYKWYSCGHVLQTILHVCQVAIGYVLMLIVMTYNVWLCTAVLVGAGTGYFVFGWRKSIVVDIN